MSIDVKKGNIISVGIVLTCNSNVLQSKTGVFFSFFFCQERIMCLELSLTGDKSGYVSVMPVK